MSECDASCLRRQSSRRNDPSRLGSPDEKDEEALTYYQKAQEISPNDTLIAFNIAMVYKNLKDYAKSKKILEKLLTQVKDLSFSNEIKTILVQEINPKLP